MTKLVYFTGDIALVDNLSIEECVAIQEPLKKLAEYEALETKGLLLKLSNQIDKDMIKAVKCLASQNIAERKGDCHMDIWNEGNKTSEYYPMACGEHENTICCPFYQEKYGTCFDKGEQSDWLYSLAELLKGK